MCTELLTANSEPSERVAFFISNDLEGECQKHKVSEYAPGHVDDEEVLARSIDFPLRHDPATGIDDSLFQDAFSMGASTQRIHGDSADAVLAIHRRYEDRASRRRSGEDGRRANPEWHYLGSVQVKAGDLRSLQLNGMERKGRVRVYDAAHNAEDPLHADVMVDSSDLAAKAQRKLLRVMLMTVACRRGLYVSPFLAPDHPSLKCIQMQMHWPA